MSTVINRPMPRVGDIIDVVPGGADGYRAPFRMRVTEADSRYAARGHAPIIGGVVINKDGRDRVYRGNPVERAVTWAPETAPMITVSEPAPASEREWFAAHREDTRRDRERNRCACMPGTVGCVNALCPGVPPVDAPIGHEVTLTPEYDAWAYRFVRAFRDQLMSYPGWCAVIDLPIMRETVPTAGGRDYATFTATVERREVTVVDFSSTDVAGARYALYVDGALISADVLCGRWPRPEFAARQIAHVLVSYLRRGAVPVA